MNFPGHKFPVSMSVGSGSFLWTGVLFVLNLIFIIEGHAQRPEIPVDVLSSNRLTSNSPDQATDVRERVVSLVRKNATLESILKDLAQQANLNITYSRKLVPVEKRIASFEVKQMPISRALNKVLEGTDLTAVINANGHAVVTRKESTVSPESQDSTKAARGAVTGKVVDSATRKGIPGATVLIVGMGYSGVTDENGTFELRNIPVGTHRVSVRVLGFVTQVSEVRVNAGEKHSTLFLLTPTAASLSEVVTTATGQQRRVEVANDIVKIDVAKVMERSPVRNVSGLLEAAQVPGVLVQRGGGDPGSPSKIRMRGISSISESNDPVIILDGMWVDNSIGRPSRIDEIDPATIETIELIRGPSAATLYGQDASNGVIVITTKRGRSGVTRWNFSYARDWGETYQKHPLSYKGWGYMVLDGARGFCRLPHLRSFHCVQDTVIVSDLNHPLIAREGREANDKFSVRVDGGSNASTYSITASKSKTIGVRRTPPVDLIRYRILGYRVDPKFTRPSGLDRNSISVAYNLNPRQNFTIGMNLSGIQSKLKDNSYKNDYHGGPVGLSDYYSIDTTDFIVDDGSLFFAKRNEIKAIENPNTNVTVQLGSVVKYEPIRGLILNGNGGIERINSESYLFERNTRCLGTTNCADTVGSRTQGYENRSVYTLRMSASTYLPLGSLSRIISLRPSIGGDYKRTDRRSSAIHKTKIPAGYSSIVDGEFFNNSYRHLDNATAGWYINSTIGLFQRIYFDLGIRKDIGSAVPSSVDTKYPKIGGSWLVSDEPFWIKNNWINLLRFRTALGHSAVQPSIEDIRGRFVDGIGYVNGKFVPLTRPASPGNRDLAPERSTEAEIGFDADVLYDRLNLRVTYAHGENRNTIIKRVLPPSAGMDSIREGRKENIARVINRNFEISTDARVIETRNTSLILNYSLTMSDNQIARVGNSITPFVTNNVQELNRIVKGYPVGALWTRKLLGFNDSNGNGLLEDHEIIVSDSPTYVGWSQPRYRASYGANLSFKRISFDARFAYQSQYAQSFPAGQEAYAVNDINAPFVDQALALSQTYKLVSDIRWSSASITYHVPVNILNRLRARSLNVSLQGSNLGLWTNYEGRDPGVNSSLLISESISDNGRTVPNPRIYVLNFQIGY